MMTCVYCGTHWSRNETHYYLLPTRFEVAGVDDPCFCDSICRRHFMKVLREHGSTELSMEDLIEEARELFDQDYIELGKDYNQLNIAGNMFIAPDEPGPNWLVIRRDGSQVLIDDVYVDIVKREMVLYCHDDIVGTIPKL